jgi:hypothetical protein
MRSRSALALNAAQQLVNLRLNPICSGSGEVRRGKLIWQFDAQPDPLGRVYKVRIEYQQGRAPRVYVVEPNLRLLAGGRSLPHVYEQDPAQLCLYLPGAGEWSPWRRISETIVPWVFLWLSYFEEWLASSEWRGGGVHPRPRRRGRRTTSAPRSAPRRGEVRTGAAL